MPSRWVIAPVGIDPTRVEPDWLHAAVARWVDQGTAGHRTSPKPWSVTPFFLVDGVAAFEFAALVPQVERALVESVGEGTELRLGPQHGTVLTAPRLVARAGWSALRAPGPARAWSLSFVSPTTFRRANRSSPLPEVEAVTRSLSTRWEAFGPPGFELPRLDPAALRSVWVSDIDGASDVLQIGDTVVSGFRGRVRYVCTADDVAPVLDSLFRLAEFTGTGSYTARGLGMTRLEPTWAPSEGGRGM